MLVNQRISEVAELLAAALQRLMAKQSSAVSREFGESSLHISPIQSGDATAWQSGEQA